MKWFFALSLATGPRYYRQVLPVRHLAKYLASRGVVVKMASKSLAGAEDADVCFFSRNIGADMVAAILHLKDRGKTIVWDLDDNLLIPHRWVERDLNRVNKEIMGLHACLNLSDHVTVSTHPLGDAIGRPYRVLPNKIDDRDWPWHPMGHRGEKPRILYAGSNTHYHDLELVRDLYHETKRSHDWFFFGCVPTWCDKHATCIPLSPIRDYPGICRLISPDYALAPIQPDRFNASKSPIKAWEMATTVAMVVASDYGPYMGRPSGVVPPGEAFRMEHLGVAGERHGSIVRDSIDNTWGSITAEPCPWKAFFDELIYQTMGKP
jgi:hypothetical protein